MKSPVGTFENGRSEKSAITYALQAKNNVNILHPMGEGVGCCVYKCEIRGMLFAKF